MYQAQGLAIAAWRPQVTFDDPNPLPSGTDCVNDHDVRPPHGLVICGPGVHAQPVPRVGYSTASAAQAVRIATRQRKEIECLLVVTSPACSVVKRGEA